MAHRSSGSRSARPKSFRIPHGKTGKNLEPGNFPHRATQTILVVPRISRGSVAGCDPHFDDAACNGITVRKGLAGALCPDHYFVSNVEECVQWGIHEGLDILVSESAGLCNRCSPHIREVLAICVIDNLSGTGTPKKIGPMLKAADVVVITKGDIVSQAEREVFAARVHMVNTKARILHVNGITGQGSFELSTLWAEGADTPTVEGKKLRFSMPAALCSYCLGETRIGSDYQMGNVRKMDLDLPTGFKSDGGPQELGPRDGGAK